MPLPPPVIVSSTVGGGFVGALVGGPVNDRYGRRFTLAVSAILFTVGAAIMGASYERYQLLVGRIVVGLGIGMSSMTGQ